MTDQKHSGQCIALVTGASRGIGQAIASSLHESGYLVFGTATTQAGADDLSERLGQGRGLVLQLSDPQTISSAIEAIGSSEGPVSVLVNNAGITRDQLLLRQKDEDWDGVIAANLTGSMLVTRTCLKGMVKQRFGRIIHISSVVASTGNPGQTNYAAAKAGLEGFSRSLALEVASRGITSNVVAPGFIETDMTAALSESQVEMLTKSIPAKRLGQGGDIASAVAFLASEQAGYITGQTLHVNGGMYLN